MNKYKVLERYGKKCKIKLWMINCYNLNLNN